MSKKTYILLHKSTDKELLTIAGTRTMSDGTKVAVILEWDGRLTTVTFADLAELVSEMGEA